MTKAAVFTSEIMNGMSTYLIVSVHGTFAGKANLKKNYKKPKDEWWHVGHTFAQKLKAQLENKFTSVIWKDFQWTGANSDRDRRAAADQLYTDLEGYMAGGTYDRVILLAHSHGGNVVNYMLDAHDEDLNVEIYTFGVPFIHLRNMFWPTLIFTFFNLLFSFIGSLMIIETLAQIVFSDRQNWYSGKWESMNFWKLIPVIFALMFIGWLIAQRQQFKQYRGRNHGKLRNSYSLIFHAEDEAIASLSSPPKRVHNFSFVIKILSAILAFVMFLWLFYLFSVKGVEGELPEYFSTIILVENAKAIFLFAAIAYFTMKSLRFLMTFFGEHIDKFFSRILNGFLFNSSLGNDTGRVKTMSCFPQVPDPSKNYLEIKDPELDRIFMDIAEVTTDALGETKSKILRQVSSTTDIMSALENNRLDVAKVLIHCNYFTTDMAQFVAKYIGKS